MNHMNVLLRRNIKKTILNSYLSDLLKIKQMVPFDSVSLDVRLRQQFNLVLLDLALFAHEQQFLFRIVVKRGK
jgi:hypothetical protein